MKVAAPARRLRIGLTGGIGSGKSTVAARLVSLGATLVDTDAIARALTAVGGEAIAPLRAAFGDVALDAHGALDRTWMRERAFADTQVRGRLEAILHPLIGREALAQAAVAATSDCVVLDIPLLVESGRWRALVDRVLVVDCPVEVQIHRVLRRAGWSRGTVDRVLEQQTSRQMRRAAADAVVVNAGELLGPLHAEVDALWRHWLHEPL